MFDLFGGVSSLRRTRALLEESLREPVMTWDYPVVREKCGCGASTETVLFDDKRAEAYFLKWRETHGCTIRAKAAASP